MSRPCVARSLGCECDDAVKHARYVEAHTERVSCLSLTDGDVIHMAGRWTTLTEIRREGDRHIRARTGEGGQVLMHGDFHRWIP